MEKRELKIVTFIKKYGLDKAIDTFKLNSKVYGHKVILKYNQIESPMGEIEVQECRGLILEIGTWDVLSLSFVKFFNSGETHAAKIDWDTAHILNKEDGTMIQVYWDWHKGEWFAATTGTAEGEGEVNNKYGTTFNQLFWETVENKYHFNTCLLDKDHVYVFELTTPYNIVVTPHGESKATLLAVRNRNSLVEISHTDLYMVSVSLGIPLVKSYDLNVGNADELAKTLVGMPWSEEGYVVRDVKDNRVKIKNPAYVHAHHLKGKMGNHHIMGIIKTNEIEEFITTFKEREEEIKQLEKAYNKLRDKLSKSWEELYLLKPKNTTPQEKKRFAMDVFEFVDKNDLKQFSGMFFLLNEGKIKSASDYLINYDDKKLYHLLID
jgi:hypothetical protein